MKRHNRVKVTLERDADIERGVQLTIACKTFWWLITCNRPCLLRFRDTVPSPVVDPPAMHSVHLINGRWCTCPSMDLSEPAQGSPRVSIRQNSSWIFDLFIFFLIRVILLRFLSWRGRVRGAFRARKPWWLIRSPKPINAKKLPIHSTGASPLTRIYRNPRSPISHLFSSRRSHL